MIGVPFHITGHKKVKLAVIVVIEEARGARPASASDASLGGHVSESAIAIVVIEDIFPVAGDKKIRIPVVVVVAHGDRHPVVTAARMGQPRGFRDVCKASVTILAVQAIPVARIAAIKVLWNVQLFGDCSTIHEKNIQETVVVVVEEGNAARHCLDQEFLSSRRILENEIHSAQWLYFKDG